VQAGCFGAALMLQPERVADCVAAMQTAVTVPVTVKTRLGVDDHDSYEFLHAFVTRLAAAGGETFIVHARKALLKGLSPKENREIPPLDYGRVYRLKRDLPQLQIIINGGLNTLEASLEQLPSVDGIMLGRAAYQDTWLLAELDRRLFATPSVAGEEVLAAFARYIERELDDGTPLRAMTRHLLGLRNGQAGGRRWRRELSHLQDGHAGLEGLRELVASFSAAAPRAPHWPETLSLPLGTARELAFNYR
jgi:tRNA-dihydrouridine synthase A